ncbi:MAG: thioredoxin [Pseudomonadota bacterium]
MSMIPFVIEIDSPESFQEHVIAKSSQLPIVVDFWAEWCQPCQILVPLLIDIAQQYNGAFILAKVNSDNFQELALQYGVKSLPTVLIFKDGQPVDSFTGALPEGEIKTLLDKHIKNPIDKVIEHAFAQLEQGEKESSLEQLKLLNREYPEEYKIHRAIARHYLLTEEYQLCNELLNALPANIQMDEEFKSLKSQLEVALAVADAPELDELEQQIQADPDNLELQLQLSNIHISQQNYSVALDILFSMIKKDSSFNDGIAKASMLKVFEILGGSNEIVRQYRKKLFSFLN